MKYQCQHKTSWGKRCTKGALKGKDYCAEHSKPNFSQTYAVGKSTFSPSGNPEIQYQEYLQSDLWKERAVMPKKKKQYTYDEIRAHLAVLERQEPSWAKVLTLEIFSDDNCVTLINVRDKKIAQFQNMEEFMNCKSYEDAITKYAYKRF